MIGSVALILFAALGLAVLWLLFTWRAATPEGAEIVANDDVVLRSERLRLSGRPDRIIRLSDGSLIPVEKKHSSKLRDSHKAQLGVYFLIMEDVTGKRPPYGRIALQDDTEIEIENTAALRRRAAELIEDVRANTPRVSPATPFAPKCARCGVRADCTYRA